MDYKSRIKKMLEWGIRNKNNILTAAFLAFGFLIGLGIGLLFNSQKPSPIIIDKNVKIGLTEDQSRFSQNSEKQLNFIGGNFVASINGKMYYPKDCKSANVIKEENRVWFDSAREAESQGYAPAKNCSW